MRSEQGAVVHALHAEREHRVPQYGVAPADGRRGGAGAAGQALGVFREGVDLSLHANVPDPAPTRLEAMLEEHCDLIRSEAELAIGMRCLSSQAAEVSLRSARCQRAVSAEA
jgi:hypothetical protein